MTTSKKALVALGLLVGIAGTSHAASRSSDSVQIAGASKFEKDTYLVSIAPSGACAAGKACKADISIAAKGEFHVNDKYPLKFKAADPAPPGLSFAKPVVSREDGKFEEKKGTLPVTFTAAKAGKAKVAGVFSFSVCSPANCVMEKVDLELDIDVK